MTSKRLLSVFGLLILCATSANAASSDIRPWLLAASFHYGMFEADEVANKGNQAFSYVQIAYDPKKWGIIVTGKGSDTHYETEGVEGSFDVTTLTDTTIATYYAFEFKGLSFRPGVDFTLPLGKAGYSNDELSRIIYDPVSSDLMIANVYGEGINIVPHGMLAWQVSEKATLGLGFKYEVTGEYDLTEEIDDEKLDPGDRFTGVVNFAYQVAPLRYFSALATYAYYGPDAQGGSDIYRVGDTMSIELRYIHGWFEAFSSVLAFTYFTQQENEIISGDGSALNAELQNSNNNLYEIYFNNIYRHSRHLTILGMVGYKNVEANEYPDDDPFFDGGRQKYFIEPGIIWYIGKSMYTTLKFRYSVIDDVKDAFAPVDTTYTIYNVDFGLVFSF